MIYKFIDNEGTFKVEKPERFNLYFPLTNQDGTLLSSVSPNLAGDIKKDNEHFLTLPAGIEDLRSNLSCRREFFLKTDKETLRLSYPSADSLEAGFLYQKIIKETALFQIEILNFIPYNLAVEVMRVKIRNKTAGRIKLTPTSFLPLYARSEKNLRDHRHVSSLLNRIDLDRYGILVKPAMVFDEKGHKINKTVYFVFGYEGENIPPQGQFPTLDYFYGEGDIIRPDAIEKDKKPVKKKLPEFDGKEVCAAFRFRKKTLKGGEETSYFLLMGLDEDKQRIKEIFLKLNSPLKVEEAFRETKRYWLGCLSRVKFDFKDKDFNNWLRWVKLQPVLRKLFGCSFLPHFDYGKGGRGWRDLWQDALALLITEPAKAGEIILNSFSGVRIDGSNATIITKEGGFVSDRNRISRVWMDHGVWPYLSLSLYMHKTGDTGILFKEAVYFSDRLLKRARAEDFNFSQNDCFLRAKTGEIYRGSILEHILVENLTQFFNVGRHNIIRLENADWNDGLDMAAANGESAAFSFMYAHNLRDICVILEKLKEEKQSITVLEELGLLLDRLNNPIDYREYKEKQKRLDEYLEKTSQISGRKIEIKIDDLIFDLKEKSAHLSGWLQKKEWLRDAGFFNGYYDNQASRVEGRQKGSVRMMLASQVFAIMSGVATGSQIKKIWVSIKKYLEDRKLGGFHLNTDFGSLYLDLGRAFGFSYGDKENGAFFNHMAVMLANSLYKRGFVKEGFEAINSVYKMATAHEAGIYPMIPEYFNRKGKGLYLYLTGSASWYIYTLTQEVLGIEFLWGDICLEPKFVSADFSNSGRIEVEFPLTAAAGLEEKIIRIVYRRPSQEKNKAYRIKEAFLEGRKILPCGQRYLIKKEDFKKINKRELVVTIDLIDI